MIGAYSQQYSGMSQDITLSKGDPTKYWSALNARIVATDQPSTFSITNEHGNESVLTIPSPAINYASTSIHYTYNGVNKYLQYVTTNSNSTPPRCQLEEQYTTENPSGPQQIIGLTAGRDSIFIITTDDAGYDCFWEFKGINSGNYDLTLLYMNNLELSSNNPCQVIYNYENSIIEKIYFVDGKNQLRFMNVRQSESNGDAINLADVEPSAIDVVSNFEISQPRVLNVVGGGNHTSGMIQYSYSLYVLNGSQTTISPLSQLVPIDKGNGLGGGELNENLGKAVLIEIPNIDRDYTHLKIYAIKYTSYNQTPQVSIIADKEIDNYSSLTYYDNGSVIQDISLEEFIFLGSAPKVPKHIEIKDSRMFLFNIQEKNFDVDLDMRAYGHNSGGQAVIWENLSSNGYSVTGSQFTIDTATYNVPLKHDAINKDYNIYKYQSNGTTLGATGKYLNVELVQGYVANAEDYQFFKDNELYRLGVQFFNGRGQVSSPKWIMDFVAPSGNLEGNYNQLKVTWTQAFLDWVNDENNFADDYSKPIGYRLLRADRTIVDRTIIAQGMLNPMVASYNATDKKINLTDRKIRANDPDASKMPSLTRMFVTEQPVKKCTDYYELSWATDTPPTRTEDFGRGDTCEVFKARTTKDWRVQTFQFNKLMQLYSPEISFQDVYTDSSLTLDVKGLHRQSYVSAWCAEQDVQTGEQRHEAKFINGLTRNTATTTQVINGRVSAINDFGWFAPSNSKDSTGFNQIYREFNQEFVPANGITKYTIYGTPEVTERGADFTAYNGDFTLRYSNSLKALLVDDFRNSSEVHEDSETQVVGDNSYAERCITLVEGTNVANAKPIESIKSLSGIAQNDGILVAELRKPVDQLYVGSSYGGNSYEAKSTTTYIPIGDYNDITISGTTIKSPGDTFVQKFNFVKLSKTDVQIADRSQTQHTEIVEFPVETTVDLKNRSDLSLFSWDNRFHPRYEEYANYNDVYSQQPTLIKTVDEGFKFKEVSEFDTRIQASKEKIPGEFIDSWTDFLENETLDLNGKYGPINGVVAFTDNIYALQDTAVARILISPRVQTTSGDGISLELGRGDILYDYDYLTTKSGTINKWSIISSNQAFYFVDLLNKAIMRSNGQNVEAISEKGMHQYFINNMKFTDYSSDLPLKGNGISVGYNPVNNDVMFSFKGTQSYTIGFNEATDSFISFYDYVPAFFISKGDKMFTSGPDGISLWEHFKGQRCNYYGSYYPTRLIMNVRPQLIKEATWNNIEYKSEVIDVNGNEVPLSTLNYIRAYNEYQNSGLIPLTLNSNISKRNRSWTALIPRHQGTMDRIKSPWAFVEVVFVNEVGEKIILHDINVLYNQY